MFTGIVETTGKIVSITPKSSGSEFQIETLWTDPDLKIGDSIAINGACMTVSSFEREGHSFSFFASFKSLELTNLSKLAIGTTINLERAMSASQRFGGHVVQGHVDGMGEIVSRRAMESNQVEEFWVSCPDTLQKYLVKKGSITVDGVSLTIVEADKGSFQLILIPETLKKTNASLWNPGVAVNLEVDILAKYIENFLEQRFSKS